MKDIGALLFSLAFLLFFLMVLLDFIGGCGSSWVQADGSRIPGECIGSNLINNLTH